MTKRCAGEINQQFRQLRQYAAQPQATVSLDGLVCHGQYRGSRTGWLALLQWLRSGRFDSGLGLPDHGLLCPPCDGGGCSTFHRADAAGPAAAESKMGHCGSGIGFCPVDRGDHAGQLAVVTKPFSSQCPDDEDSRVAELVLYRGHFSDRPDI